LHQDYIITQNLLKEKDFYTAVETKLLESVPRPTDNLNVSPYPHSDILQVNSGTEGSRYYLINTNGAKEDVPKWSTSRLEDISDLEVNTILQNTQGFEPLKIEMYDTRFDTDPTRLRLEWQETIVRERISRGKGVFKRGTGLEMPTAPH